MEKYQVDFSKTAHFRGIRILFEFLEEGLDHAQENGIKEICVWADSDSSKHVVNFDFLKDRDFIETFHWLVPMSKKSSIDGLKYLSGLKNLRWNGASDFNLNLAIFPALEELNIGYGPKISGWENLTSLKKLLIGSVKTSDLSLLQQAINLEYLRIIGGTFTTIAGLENCKKLETLFLQKCTALITLQPTIRNLENLVQLNLEGCKKVNMEQELADLDIMYISII